MKTLATALSVVLLATSAAAADLTVTLTTGQGPQRVNLSAVVSMPDAEARRVLDGAKAVQARRSARGEARRPAAQITDHDVLRAAADEVVDALRDRALSHERSEATKAAIRGLAPMSKERAK